MAQAAPTTPTAGPAAPATYILSDGVSQRVIQPGHRETVQAVAGRRYKLLRMEPAGARPVADVIAIADGGTDDGHLRLMTGDHTEIVIRDFFKAPDTSIDIPRPDGDMLTLDKATSPLSRGADGSDLLGMAGTRSGLGELARDFAGHFDVLSADRFATALVWSGAMENAAPVAPAGLGSIMGSAVGGVGTAAALGSSNLAVGAGALAGVGAVIAGVASASGSSSSASSSVENATQDPLAPLISIATISDDYRINQKDYDSIVGKDGTPGTGLTVSGATLRVDDGNILTVTWAGIEKTVAVTGGKWSVTFAPNEVPKTDGAYSISVHVKNTAGKEKTETHELPIDRTASIAIDPITGDGVVNATELNSGITLTGSTDFEDGRSISVSVGDTKKTVTAQDGHWSAAFSKAELPTQSGGMVFLSGTDAAGNEAMIFANLSYDLTASISIAKISGDDLLNAVEISSGTIVVSGASSSIEDGRHVTVTWGGVSREATIASNTWSVSFTAADVPADGVSSIMAAATDEAGNTASASRNLTIDRDVPTIAINAIATDDRVNAAEAAADVAITGTTNAADGAEVTVVWNDVSHTGTVTNGVWTVAFPTGQVPGNNSYTITATVSDAAGNHGSATRTIVVAKDPLLQTVSASSGFRIEGESAADNAGYSVAHLGDVNGDGLDDLLLSAPNADPSGRDNAGRSYVVFGKTDNTTVSLSAVAAGQGGFVINGSAAADISGWTVSGIGDMNHDGLADFAIGTKGAANGTTYVVWGKSNGNAIDLATPTSGWGFKVEGQMVDADVSSAGDVNGDGTVDLLVSQKDYGSNAGRAYIVFGSGQSGTIQLSDIAAGAGGYVIEGVGAAQAGMTISDAGDINGDGLSDQILGLNSTSGRIYVVYGHTGSAPIQLSAVGGGAGGFMIEGACGLANSGNAVSGAGDVNGDGIADILVGSPGDGSGRAYVLFGSTAPTDIQLSGIAAGTGSGFVINGESAGDEAGFKVSHAGDFNGDGLSDILLTAPGSDYAGPAGGRAYIVFGKSGSAAVALSSLDPQHGFALAGLSGNGADMTVAYAGDINGDGLSDLIVGAPATSSGAGSAYILFGSTSGGFGQTFFDQVGGTGADSLSDGGTAKSLAGGEGNDIIQLAAASVAYGGAGNDTFEIADQAVITALASSFGNGGNTAQLARIDGGSGIDTLKLTGSGLNLVLGSITNRSAGTALEGLDRLSSIEIIDITGSGDNTLTLSLHDVLDLAGSNIFTDSNGFGFGASVPRHQMIVKSDAADHVILSDQAGWFDGGTVTMDGTTYTAYVSQNAYAAIYLEHPIV